MVYSKAAVRVHHLADGRSTTPDTDCPPAPAAPPELADLLGVEGGPPGRGRLARFCVSFELCWWEAKQLCWKCQVFGKK